MHSIHRLRSDGLPGTGMQAFTKCLLSEIQVAEPSSSQLFPYYPHSLACPREKVKCFRHKDCRFFVFVFVQYSKKQALCDFLLTNRGFYAYNVTNIQRR
jgi:hypothetical protein